MKAGLLKSIISICFLGSTLLAGAQQRCHTVELDSLLRKHHPEIESLQDFETILSQRIQTGSAKALSNDILVIPVVIHIIHNGEAVGTGTNISDAQAISQITVLNEDFGRYGAGTNTNPVSSDTRIRFCLAQRDPSGNATNGIDRVNRNTAGFTAPPYSNTAYINSTIKPATSWDPNRYCNIWCLNFGSSLLGYAQFPNNSGLTGFVCNQGAANTDGVVLQYSSFGRINTTAPYNLGKTCTHEIGHWLGLRHIWGDATCGDDFCGDTPTHQTNNSGCPSHPKPNTCGTADEMFENYMDYSYDACLNIFTRDQTTRMRTVLTTCPRRASLLTSEACLPPVANDVQVIRIVNPAGDNCAGPITPQVTIKNNGTSTLTSCNIFYALNNQSAQAQSFNGTLAPGAATTVSLPSMNPPVGNNSYTVYTTLPNNQADVNTTYDTLTNTFSITAGAALPFAESFSGMAFPPNNWTVNNVNNDCYTWRRQTGIIGPSGTPVSTVFNYHYQYTVATSGETDELISPLIDLSTANTGVALYFDLAYARRSSTAYEDLKVEVSTNCGLTYTTMVYNKSGALTGSNDLRTISSDVGTDWKPTLASHWRTEKILLDAFIGSVVRLKFTVTNRNGNNIYLDNIALDNRNTISFVQTAISTSESSSGGTIDCRGYTDVSIPVSISSAPTTSVTLNVTATNASAYSPADYQLLTNTLTFPAGSMANQFVSVRIFNDNSIENTESFTLSLSSTQTTFFLYNSNAVVDIADNDVFPSSGASTTLLNQDFETLTIGTPSGGWTTRSPTAGNNSWQVGANAGMGGSRAVYLSNNATSQPFTYDNTSTTNTLLYSPALSTTGLSNLNLRFTIRSGGEVYGSTVYDFGALYYATTPTGALTALYGPSEASATFTLGGAGFYNLSAPVNFSITLPAACENLSTIYLVWRWQNDNSEGTTPMAIDNVVLTGAPPPPIETALNSTATLYLGPLADNVYTSASGNLIARINNLTTFDYGCTTVRINRAGTSAAEYYSSGASNFLASKTYSVTSSSNSTTGSYNLTLYLSAAEASGYTTATTRTPGTSTLIYKSNGSIANVTSAAPFGNGTSNTEVSVSVSTGAQSGGGFRITGRFSAGIGASGAGFGIGQCSNRIITGTPSATTPCASSSVSVPFQALGLFTTGNLFTAQLSDGAGSFAAPVSLGTLSSVPNGYFSGTVAGTLPSALTTASAFRIRINASAPASPVMNDNASNLSFNSTGTWLGASSNWQTASNWCGGVPTATTNVTIPSGSAFNPSLSLNGVCNNLTLSGASTRVALNGFTLTVNAAISGTGRITGSATSALSVSGTGNAGTLNMDNASAATKSLYALTLNKTGTTPGITLGDTLNLAGVLTLNNGTLNTGGFLKLLSSSTETARIAPVAGTGNINGTLTSFRLAPGGRTGWANLGNPVTGANILQWQDDFATSGFSGSSGQTSPPFVSVYSYNESVSGLSSLGYQAPASASDLVPQGKGFMVYLGNGSVNTTAIMLDATGTPAVGNVTLPVSYTASTPSALPNEDGWNLIANPYCSVINWDAAAWTKTNVSASVYIYNADAGNYAVYQGGSGIGINGGSNLIASHQGFWVKATAASPVLTIAEACKSSAQQVLLRSASVPENGIRLGISSYQGSDECVVFFSADSSSSASCPVEDAPRLANSYSPAPGIGIRKQDRVLSLACNSSLPGEDAVPLFIKIPSPGGYNLHVENQAGEVMLLDVMGVYTQNLMSGQDVLLALEDTGVSHRFFLKKIAAPGGISSVNAETVFSLSPNPAQQRVYFSLPSASRYRTEIFSAEGKSLWSGMVRNGQSADVSLFPSGTYFVKAVPENGIPLNARLLICR